MMKEATILAGVVAGAGLTGVSVSHWVGVCVETGTILSSDEKIRLAITAVVKDTSARHLIEKTTQGYSEVPIPVYYTSVEDFMEHNPGCCRMSETGHKGLGPPTGGYRISGQFAGFVEIIYLGNDFSAKPFRPIVKTAHLAVTNCGRI